MTGRRRRPLVALHGFLGCAADFDPLFAELGRDRTCVAVELPGHGAAPPPPTHDPLGSLASRLAEAIEPLGVVDYLGYSMGGRLLQQLIGDPRLGSWRKLVLVGAHPGIADPVERENRLLADAFTAERLVTGDFADFLDDWYAQPLFGRLKDAPAYDAMLARRLDGDPTGLAQALDRLGAGRFAPRLDALRRADGDVLLIAGADDTKYGALNETTATALPNARCVTIPDAAHAPHVEQPTAFAEVVRAFLDR